MSIDDLASTTRVFVSGLPPSFTSKDLRSFFGKKFTVTDAHVLPNRRIGFVGLTNHDVAEQAAKYFNRSFIKMSKISVELAKPVDVQRDTSGRAAPVSHPLARDQPESPIQASINQKRKRDRNDDGEALRGQEGSEQHNTFTLEVSTPIQNDQINETVTHDIDEPQQGVPASDGDWLRNKTSRVLDLEGPADEARRATLAIPLRQDDQSSATVEDANVEEQNEEVIEEKPQITNGRLFLRNLSFEVTEADLRNLLSPFGTVEEVSIAAFRLFSTSNDVFLIGTSYALHMILNWREIF